MFFPTNLLKELSYLLLGIGGIILLIVLDVILGVAAAIKKKEFDFKYLLDFLGTNIFPYIIVWGAFSSIPVAMVYWEFPTIVTTPLLSFATVSYAFIVAELVSSVWEHVKVVMPTVKTK